MDPCCGSARTSPQVQRVGDIPDSLKSPTAKLLDDSAKSPSPTAKLLDTLSSMADLRLQLTEFQHRQEELFTKVMDHQDGLQHQLLSVEQRQEDLMSEFNTVSSKLDTVVNTTEQVSLMVSRPQRRKSTDSTGADSATLRPNTPEEELAVFGATLSKSASVTGTTASNRASALSQIAAMGASPSAPRCASPRSSGRSSGRSSAFKRKSRKSIGQNMNFGIAEMHKLALEEEEDLGCKKRVERMLKGKEFEFGIAGAIMVNAFIISWECQYSGIEVGFNLRWPGYPVQAHAAWPGADTAFLIFDWFFGLLFLLEMILKLMCWRCRYFYNSDGWRLQEWELEGWRLELRRFLWSVQGWNILDFLCVFAFLIEKVAEMGAVNPQMLRLLRLFRLFRMIRLLRDLETLDHLYIMTTAISHLSKVLTWAIIFLTVVLLACNLFLVQILHATYFNKVNASDLTKDQLSRHHEMYEYFGTCTRCMLSMFEITLGDWQDITRLLSEEVSEWFTLVCVLHKLTIGFAVIGVITGVILQETFKVAQTDDVILVRQKQRAGQVMRAKMKVLFEHLDDSGDGKVELDEFNTIADDPEIRTWLSSLDIETDDLTTLFSLIDVEGKDYVTLDEVVKRVPRIKGNARGIDLLSLRKQLSI